MNGELSQELAIRQETELILNRMEQDLEKVEDPRRAHAISAQAEAIRQMAKKAKRGIELINRAVEVKIRAERRMGKLIMQMKSNGAFAHGGDHRSSNRSNLKLRDLGIEHNEASRCQQLARIPDAVLDRFVHVANEFEDELTSASFIRLAGNYNRRKASNSREPAQDQSCRDNSTVEPVRDQKTSQRSPRQIGGCSMELAESLGEVVGHLDQLKAIFGAECELDDVHLRYACRLIAEVHQILYTAVNSRED